MPVETLPAQTPTIDADERSAAARQALLDVAARLEAQAVQCAGAARAARLDWSGPHRAHFDVERANRDARVASIVARCRRLARG